MCEVASDGREGDADHGGVDGGDGRAEHRDGQHPAAGRSCSIAETGLGGVHPGEAGEDVGGGDVAVADSVPRSSKRSPAPAPAAPMAPDSGAPRPRASAPASAPSRSRSSGGGGKYSSSSVTLDLLDAVDRGQAGHDGVDQLVGGRRAGGDTHGAGEIVGKLVGLVDPEHPGAARRPRHLLEGPGVRRVDRADDDDGVGTRRRSPSAPPGGWWWRSRGRTGSASTDRGSAAWPGP